MSTKQQPKLPGPADLHWHALNYRTAYSGAAEDMWQELLAYVTAWGVERYRQGWRDAAGKCETASNDIGDRCAANGVPLSASASYACKAACIHIGKEMGE
jgi:hypothetical protein